MVPKRACLDSSKGNRKKLSHVEPFDFLVEFSDLIPKFCALNANVFKVAQLVMFLLQM